MTAITRRRRRQGVLVAPWVLPAGSAGGWAYLGQPLHWEGLAGMLALALAVTIVLPAVVVSARSLPLMLVPVRWRISYRHRREERGLGRPSVPAYLRRATYAADRDCCLYCWHALGLVVSGGLQWDHIRPWASGGLTVLWNGAALCGPHNRVKSNYWVDRDGYVHYRPWKDAGNKKLAAAILAVELRARRNPLRWIRAALSLAA